MHEGMLFAEAVVDPSSWFAEDALSAAFDLEPFLLPSGLANVSLDLGGPSSRAVGAAAGANVSVQCWNKSETAGGGGEEVNDTTGGEIDEGNQFILPWWRQVIWTLLFAVMVVVATGGNVIVIWIVLAHKRMRTVTNYFLVNLSVADTIVSTLNVTFNYTYMLNSDWPFGTLYCKVSQFVAVLSICASVFTLMAISIDRYVAIMSPLRPRMGRRTTLCIALGIWAVGTALSMPMLLFFTTYVHHFPNGEYRVICYAEWPDGPSSASFQEYVYNVIFMVLTYFLPIGSMSYTYVRVGVELWGSQSIGECTQRQLENIKSKRRVVKMMIVVVSIFAICWLPFHVYFIVSSLFPQINSSSYIQEVYLAIYWLAMSNSMYNPIIYCWMNSRFRRGFKQFFSCCPCINVRREMLSRREVVTSRYSCSGSPETQCRIMRNGSVHIPLHSMGAGESFSSRHRNVLYSAADSSGGGRPQYLSATTSGGGVRLGAKWQRSNNGNTDVSSSDNLRPSSSTLLEVSNGSGGEMPWGRQRDCPDSRGSGGVEEAATTTTITNPQSADVDLKNPRSRPPPTTFSRKHPVC